MSVSVSVICQKLGIFYWYFRVILDSVRFLRPWWQPCICICTAHTFTALSSEAVSNFWLSGLNWTLRTAACPAAAFSSVESPLRSGTQSLTVESLAEEAIRLPVRENWTSKIGPVCPVYLVESNHSNFYYSSCKSTCMP